MNYKPSTEYETAKSRVSSLIAEIDEQLQALNNVDDDADVNDLIAEQEKSSFIAKQAAIINGITECERLDDRDGYIAKLESDLKKADGDSKHYLDQWYKERQKVKDLKSALISLTAVLNSEN